MRSGNDRKAETTASYMVQRAERVDIQGIGYKRKNRFESFWVTSVSSYLSACMLNRASNLEWSSFIVVRA